MSDKKDDAELVEDKPVKKKGRLKKLLIPVVGGLVLVGGGAGAGLYAAGMGGGAKSEHAEEEADKPKLVPKGEHAEAPEGDGEGGHGGGEEAADSEEMTAAKAHAAEKGEETPSGHDGDKYEATYVPIEQNFTANLRDSDALVQLTLGVSTFYDGKVIANLQKHMMPIRSAILMQLGDEDADAIGSPDGKRALQKHLTQAINRVLRQKEGFGGIDDVYFTSFIVQ